MKTKTTFFSYVHHGIVSEIFEDGFWNSGMSWLDESDCIECFTMSDIMPTYLKVASKSQEKISVIEIPYEEGKKIFSLVGFNYKIG